MPRRVAPLSVKRLASVRPGQRPIELVDGYVPGLRIRILPSGTKAWSLNIRDSKGVRRRFEVGSGLSLAEARRKAEDLRRNIRGGADPTTERRAARQWALAAKGGVGTLAALVETYFTNGPGARQRRAAKSRQQLETVFATVTKRGASRPISRSCWNCCGGRAEASLLLVDSARKAGRGQSLKARQGDGG